MAVDTDARATPVGLSHLDEKGAARMVDVSEKADTVRQATAEAYVVMLPATLALTSNPLASTGVVPETSIGAPHAKQT